MNKSALLYALLISSSIAPLFGNHDKPTAVFDNGDKFFEAFFDANTKHNNQPLTWWLVQMVLIAKKENDHSLDHIFKKLGEACTVKPGEAKADRAPRIASIFMDYKAYFSKELQNQIKKMGFSKVLQILKVRAAK